MSHEIRDDAEAETFRFVEGNMCGPLLREGPSLCRGRRLYHVHKEHTGTWETSDPAGRREPARSVSGRRGAEADDERG